MDIQELQSEIEKVFSIRDMPAENLVTLHGHECPDCAGLLTDLEQYRDKPIDGEVIRLIHQELYHLSPLGWSWILPHYLRYCLTPEAIYNRFETEFLIYSLAPDLEFEKDSLFRMSSMSGDQVRCLQNFLDWCLNQTYWNDFCPEEIVLAKTFLEKHRPWLREKIPPPNTPPAD